MADETGKDDKAKQGMIDDISSELRDWAFIVDETIGKAHVVMLSGSVFSKAADEIDITRMALCLAVGELSTNSKYISQSPDTILNLFMEEARKNWAAKCSNFGLQMAAISGDKVQEISHD